MGKFLDLIDRQVDVNTIIYERCLSAAVQTAGKQVMPQFYGPEQDPATQDGVIMAAAVMCQSVLRSVTIRDEDIDELLKEYGIELEERKRLALEERDNERKASMQVALEMQVGAGDDASHGG